MSAVKNGVMLMMSVMGSQSFCSKTSSEARFEEGGGGTPLFRLYTGQVCAAEHNVLKIKQGVEFYYFNSKILIIYFIILMVKFYYNSKFA